MKICGIIAEYNPFHNGHKLQLDSAIEKSNADLCIVSEAKPQSYQNSLGQKQLLRRVLIL